MLRKIAVIVCVSAAILFLLSVMVAAVNAQDSKPEATPATTPATVPVVVTKAITNEHKYHLQALIAKRQAAASQLDTLLLQFIQSNPQAKQLQDAMSDLGQRQSDLLQTICKEASVAPEKCTTDIVDPEQGVIKIQ